MQWSLRKDPIKQILMQAFKFCILISIDIHGTPSRDEIFDRYTNSTNIAGSADRTGKSGFGLERGTKW